jgi:hypothetical protein
MNNPIIVIHNVETGEIIEREMNAQELTDMENNKAVEAARLESEATKAADKAALLEKLGITEDEARLLIG